MIDEDVARFVQDGLGSVWALTLMLTLRENPDRRWTAGELVAHLRASEAIVRDLLPRLGKLGLLVDSDAGQWRWRPVNCGLDDLCRRVAEEYARRPVGIVNLIAQRRSNLRLLADVFRFWK